MADDYSAPRENIVLVGFMGTGKSSIGRFLAKRLGFQFIDTDQIITQRVGMPIARYFAEHGEPDFRDVETSVLRSILHLRRCVLSTGGGIVVREENRRLLQEFGFVVGLSASDDTIFERVSRNNKRPLLQTENPRETMVALLERRRPMYAEAAHWTLDTTRMNHDEAVSAIIIREARRAFSWHRAA